MKLSHTSNQHITFDRIQTAGFWTKKEEKLNVTSRIWAFGGQQYIVAYCGSPSPFPTRAGNPTNNSLICYKFFEKGVCLRKFPLWKIVGPPWKEGEIRIGVDKVMFKEVSRQGCKLDWKFSRDYFNWIPESLFLGFLKRT